MPFPVAHRVGRLRSGTYVSFRDGPDRVGVGESDRDSGCSELEFADMLFEQLNWRFQKTLQCRFYECRLVPAEDQ